jgi:hypothetical protein
VGPTYGSHADAWTRAGALTQTIGLDEGRCARRASRVHDDRQSNNPDGRIVERSRLLALHDSLAQHGGMLIVDEAFGADVAPEVSVAAVAGACVGTQAHRVALVRQVLRVWPGACDSVSSSPRRRSPPRSVGLIGEWPVCSDALARVASPLRRRALDGSRSARSCTNLRSDSTTS